MKIASHWDSIIGYDITIEFCRCQDTTAVLPCSEIVVISALKFVWELTWDFHRIWIVLETLYLKRSIELEMWLPFDLQSYCNRVDNFESPDGKLVCVIIAPFNEVEGYNGFTLSKLTNLSKQSTILSIWKISSVKGGHFVLVSMCWWVNWRAEELISGDCLQVRGGYYERAVHPAVSLLVQFMGEVVVLHDFSLKKWARIAISSFHSQTCIALLQNSFEPNPDSAFLL